jgi:DNA-binding response OmpR family regulator
MRLLLAEYFRRLGFQVEERESGMAALEATYRGDLTASSSTCRCRECQASSCSNEFAIEAFKRRRSFLTAHDALSDKVAGFEAGADDYLAKPFSPRELEYRVEALLRRGGAAPPERTANASKSAIS